MRSTFILTASILLAISVAAQEMTVTTIAGTGSAGQADGTGTAASFDRPSGVAVDASGNIFVADQNNHTIRKITTAGVVSVFAGAADTIGSTNANGTNARFKGPAALAFDGSGNLWVADTQNCTIRKITPTGDVTTPVGAAGLCSDQIGSGASTRLAYPRGIHVDGAGNVFISDTENFKIKQMNGSTQNVTLYSDMSAVGAYLYGVTMDDAGYLYVAAQEDHSIRRIPPGGGASTRWAGGGDAVAGVSGNLDGTGTAARFNSPQDIDFDGDNFYVADGTNHAIRKITAAAVVTTVAGLKGTSGFVDGTGTTARFNRPSGIAFAGSGKFAIGDWFNHAIRQGALPTVIAEAHDDFTADGLNDLIWRQPSTGKNVLWAMDGESRLGYVSLLDVAGNTWSLAGTGHFNPGVDSHPDLLWRNSTTGQNVAWGMSGTTRSSYASLLTVPSPWEIGGVDDFDGDGDADIVWRNPSSGQNVLWTMDGTTRTSFTSMLTVIGMQWRIAGVGDFDGDGKPDLIWRNGTSGQNVIWFMDGANRTSFASTLTVPEAAWRIQAVGDYDGDGKADLVWRNVGSGQNVIWFMDSATRSSYASTMTVSDLSWEMQSPR